MSRRGWRGAGVSESAPCDRPHVRACSRAGGAADLSGSKSSADSPHHRSSRCRSQGDTRTVVPRGTAYAVPPLSSDTSSAAHLPTMYAGGRRRMHSYSTASVKGSPPEPAASPTAASPPAAATSRAMRSCISGRSMRKAHAHARTIAEVSCPATMSVINSSRSALSPMPWPSPSASCEEGRAAGTIRAPRDARVRGYKATCVHASSLRARACRRAGGRARSPRRPSLAAGLPAGRTRPPRRLPAPPPPCAAR